MVVAPAGEFPDGAAAVGAGAALPRDPDAPWAIADRKPDSYLTDLQHPWRRIRARAGLGEGLPMIGKLLGHPAPHRRWAPHPAPVSHGDGQTARRDPRRPARRSVAPRVCGPAHHGRARRGGRRASPRGRRWPMSRLFVPGRRCCASSATTGNGRNSSCSEGWFRNCFAREARSRTPGRPMWTCRSIRRSRAGR